MPVLTWVSVKTAKPPCSKDPDALGLPVLIWPNNLPTDSRHPSVTSTDGFCYYGRRATGRPAFYLFGAAIEGVTHWARLPKGPKEPPARKKGFCG